MYGPQATDQLDNWHTVFINLFVVVNDYIKEFEY